MSYQVLARKWRPRTFEDMVGQEHVLQALIHALDNQRLHHAYLFTGTRGVGKTTIGRLLARCLNCETGVTATPCGTCSSCREIQEGRFVDLIEIDAASRTGVDDMRELTDNVQYSPSRGRFKVYLIDEVHMLTTQSFNAFLKTLEEPPEHVKFLLATTDPQKLPVTVLSRCLQFNLKRMTPEHIAGHLRYVLTEEGIPFEEPALWLLARAADGSMRDALSLTDQAIAFGNQKLSASDVSNMLGTIDQRDIEKLVNALVENDGPALLSEISRVSDFAPDYSVILADLLSLFHRVTMEQVVPGSVDNALGDAAQVESLARRLSAEDAQLFYQAALMGRKDLAVTPDARMGFEMTLLRMLAFRPGADRREPPAIASGGTSSEQESREDPEPGPVAPEPQAQQPEPLPEQAAPEDVARRAVVTPAAEAEPEAGPAPVEADAAWLASLDAAAESAAVEHDGAEESVSEPVVDQPPIARTETLPDSGGFVWERDFRSLGIVGMPGNLASNAAMSRNGNEIVLTIDEGHARLLNARHQEKIREALRNHFGDTITLHIEQGDAGGKTPAAWEERRRRARQKEAEEAIRSDPAVKSIVERFGARVVEDSIRPV
ncbi:DNA polymerase III subunit gamma/tau [Marinobacter orientalis]|uniref:DNA polymerase III subunit gamma/tau n=1 Tax=Marinobacter orientalis TaxID=1928859 RepID=A0A7Y0RCM8_9GAMM|nr:DNA polymerase III subunit gamma/tau [Marinobacter orientalis]NMT63770.1 DNA polymerase III subunit gamma/tau [Marinobacter orientalis]TGX49880.1 DNA polymerase III subunit gamma/tau [Marinobacter orientalis]